MNLPYGVKINNLIGDLRTLSWEASEILLNYAQILKDTNNKSNILENDNSEDPVTKADLQVNELIIHKINEKYKDISWGILSEENVKSGSDKFDSKYDWNWVLDPLDGTKDFIQGTGEYAMHLSLNYMNKPYLGVVLIPDKGELWISNGEKVWCEKKNGLIYVPQPYRKKSLRDMVLVTSKNHRNKNLKSLIEKLHVNEVKFMGSIGCKIASILRGDSDIYISLSLPGKSSPKDWDFAAPEAILRGTGGSITNIENRDLSYGNDNYEQRGVIIASNNNLMHQDFCLEIKKIIKEYDIYPF